MESEEFQALERLFGRTLKENLETQSLEQFLSALLDGHSSGEIAPTRKIVRSLLTRIGEPGQSAKIQRGVGEKDIPFVRSILALTAKSDHRAKPDWAIRNVGPELDFLENSCFLPALTPIQIVNLMLLRRIPPAKNVAIVTTVRDEGPYLIEWIAFNRAIGVTDIFVYTNENADGSDELLRVLATHGIIRLLRNSMARGINPQRKAYQHAFHLLDELRDYRWVMFLDADEYLVPARPHDHNICNFISEVESIYSENLPGAVVFPWDWRLSDRAFERTGGSSFDRYPHSIPHRGVKSLTRLGAALGMCEVHIPTLASGTGYVDSALLPLERDVIWGAKPKSDRGGSIAHFWGKSFEEFAVKKMKGDLLGLERAENPFLREFRQYFQWSAALTPENLRPLPAVLADRMRRQVEELVRLPDVAPAVKHVDEQFAELVGQIEKAMKLRATYQEMLAKFPTTM